MKRTLVLLVMMLALIAGCGGTGGGAAEPEENNSSEDSTVMEPTTQNGSSASSTVRIAASDGESVEVRVEIADDAEEMARGLMERTALAEDAGMLFVYPEERELSFWMKDTLIPLSIAFMDSEGRIVDIQDMKALDDTPPHYVSDEPARYALEVNEGFFDERGVKVGDRVALPG